MTDWTDAEKSPIVKMLNNEGCAPGDSVHSWRCSEKDRWPDPCDCTETLAQYALDAAEPIIRARIEAEDRAIEEREEAALGKLGRV